MRLNIDDDRLAVSGITHSELLGVNFDYGIYSIGYEERSSFVASELNAKNLIAVDLGGSGVASYESNLRRARQRKDKIVKKGEIELGDKHNLLPSPPVNIFLDVSSMDRRTMSLVIYQVLRSLGQGAASLYVLYAPAKFVAPSATQLPVESSAPVNDLLSGYPRDPRFPTVLFIGLGYEVGLAIGVVEMFEPARVFAFVPRGEDKRYDRQVDRVNAPLFEKQNYVTRVPYNVYGPTNTFIALKERILALRDHTKIVIVPLGPKIFSSMSILAGYVYAPDVAVWRFSTQLDTANAERVADRRIVGYKLEVRAPGRNEEAVDLPELDV